VRIGDQSLQHQSARGLAKSSPAQSEKDGAGSHSSIKSFQDENGERFENLNESSPFVKHAQEVIKAIVSLATPQKEENEDNS
jgi:hypothetical protein